MSRVAVAVAVAIAAVACSGSEAADRAPAKDRAGSEIAVVRELPAAPMPPPAAAPAPAPAPVVPAGQTTIDITLRSSPSGARVAVDGVPVGTTPMHWMMAADGKEHQFTFDHPGFAFRWFRFVPVQSGLLHARLEPVVTDEPEPNGDPGVVETPAPAPEPPTQPPRVVTPAPRIGPQP